MYQLKMVKNERLKISSSLCFQGDLQFCITEFYYSVSKRNIHAPLPHKEIKLITHRNEGLESCSPFCRLTITDKKGPGRPPGSTNPFCPWGSGPLMRLGYVKVICQLAANKGNSLGLSHHPASLLAVQDEIPNKARNSLLHSGKPAGPLLPLFPAHLPKQFDGARHRACDPNHVFSLEL